MKLRDLLDLLQEDHWEDWMVLPSGPAERMVNGFVDAAASTEPPALAALQPLYVAWNSARPRYAIVLLNGSPVWQVLLASIDWGAGITGYLPWPNPHYGPDAGPETARPVIGWRTTSWEASFARLLVRIARHDEFRSGSEEVAAGMYLEQRHPLD